ncbi:MAG: hypothetical protein RQ745_13725 [Longimicrobiales bacterium]|nr:hypothetical protein [Longimicrobiales bacterium]
MRHRTHRLIRATGSRAPETVVALTLTLVALVATGCLAATWHGYRSPGPGELVEVAPDYPYCVDVGLQNLDARQASAVREAVRDVCAIVVSPRFRSELMASDWLANCDRGPDGGEDVIEGSRLAGGFDALPSFSVHPRKAEPGVRRWYADYGAGFTATGDNRIALDPARIEAWNEDDPSSRAALVNAIARELTHLRSSALRDDGHGTDRCPDHRLASHAVGDLAARIWIEGLRAPPGRIAEYIGYDNTWGPAAPGRMRVEAMRVGGDTVVVAIEAPFSRRCVVPSVHGSAQDDRGTFSATVAWEGSGIATRGCEAVVDPSRYGLRFLVPDTDRLQRVRVTVNPLPIEGGADDQPAVFEVPLRLR